MDRLLRLGLLILCFAIQALCVRASVAQTRGAQAPLGASEVVSALLVARDVPQFDADATRRASEVAPVQVRNRTRQAVIGGTIMGGVLGGVFSAGAVALAEGYNGDPNKVALGLGVGTVVGATVGALLGHFYTSERSPR